LINAEKNRFFAQGSVVAILDKFFEALGGSGWVNSTNWGTNASVCDWSGIGCDGDGNVVSIELVSNNLVGQIPDEIANLTTLQVLDLSANPRVDGPVPASMAQLTALRELRLLGCNISSFPWQQISTLPNLTVIDLSENAYLQEVPDGLETMAQLEYLDLSATNILGPLSMFSGFTNLIPLARWSATWEFLGQAVGLGTVDAAEDARPLGCGSVRQPEQYRCDRYDEPTRGIYWTWKIPTSAHRSRPPR
jgi:hypothetical protein